MSELWKTSLADLSKIGTLLTGRRSKESDAPATVAPTALLDAKKPKRVRRARSLRALPLGEIFDRVNWSNDPERALPSVLPDLVPGGKRMRPPGAIALGQVFDLINWTNAKEPPAWPIASEEEDGSSGPAPKATPGTIETMLSFLNWGD